MSLDDDAGPGLAQYDWEKTVQHGWDADLGEDEEGNLVSNRALVGSERDRSLRARQNRVTQSVRRGLIRYLAVAMDASESAAVSDDYRPNRLVVMKECLKRFISDYFDENPISQLCLMIMHKRVAERITDLSANPRAHINRLQHVWDTEGKASLGNTIEVAIKALKNVPDYGHRELLVIFASLSSVDPESVDKAIEKAQAQKIRISIICLAAEVYVCKTICARTGGTCSVALDSTHFQELLKAHTAPAPELQTLVSATTDFIYMGFPKKVLEGPPTFCYDGRKTAFQVTAYVCPRCFTKATEIPTSCCTCTLQLNSSTHIARSHHHLFPVPAFEEIAVGRDGNGAGAETDDGESSANGKRARPPGLISASPGACHGCLEPLVVGSLAGQCPQCHAVFCVDCDIFVHDGLHVCPSCV